MPSVPAAWGSTSRPRPWARPLSTRPARRAPAPRARGGRRPASGRRRASRPRSGCTRSRRARRRGASRATAASSSAALQRGQVVHVAGFDPPAGVGAAPQRAQARARARRPAPGRPGRSRSGGRQPSPATTSRWADPSRRALAATSPARAGCSSSAGHRRAGGRQPGGLAARAGAQVDHPLTGLGPHRLGDPLRGRVLAVAVVAFDHRADSFIDSSAATATSGTEVRGQPVDDPVRVAQPGGLVGPVPVGPGSPGAARR